MHITQCFGCSINERILLDIRRVMCNIMGFPGGTSGKRTCLPMKETRETQVQSLGQEDPLEEEMATHSSILAWEFP